MPALRDLVGGIPYEQLTPSQREEWAAQVRQYGFRVCETCGGRTGDFCYTHDTLPNSEVRRKHPRKVERNGWCNGWSEEYVKPW